MWCCGYPSRSSRSAWSSSLKTLAGIDTVMHHLINGLDTREMDSSMQLQLNKAGKWNIKNYNIFYTFAAVYLLELFSNSILKVFINWDARWNLFKLISQTEHTWSDLHRNGPGGFISWCTATYVWKSWHFHGQALITENHNARDFQVSNKNELL